MNPQYQAIIDPLICDLISIVKRSTELSIDELTVELKERFKKADDELEPIGRKEWKYAKYALVAWVDAEIITNQYEWKDNTLEDLYWPQLKGNAYTDFFRRAQKAYEHQYFNAYEIFFICFMLGFQGVYRSSDRSSVPEELPKTGVDWQKMVSRRLATIRGDQKLKWDETRIVDAENNSLDGANALFNNSLFLLFVVIFFMMAWFLAQS